MPEDQGNLQAVLDGVKALNERYGPDRFFVFHRRRQWNPAEGCWMAWERKRGKLLEFNRLLRGCRDTSYVVHNGDVSSLPRIRYVITLDADTQMPRETAHRLIGTLAHPLNEPHFDLQQGRVVGRLRHPATARHHHLAGGGTLLVCPCVGRFSRH